MPRPLTAFQPNFTDSSLSWYENPSTRYWGHSKKSTLCPPPYAVRSVTKLTIVKMAHFVPNFHKFLGDHRYYRPSFKLSLNVAPKVRLSSQTSDCRPNSSTTVDCCKQPSTFVYKYLTAICERSTVVREHSTLIHKHSMVVHKCSTVVHRLFTNVRQLFRVVRECSTFK